MCTAICDGHLCGRTLDNEYSYGENVISLKKDFEIPLLYEEKIVLPQGILGVGIMKRGFPLIYDGINESGLFIAGLNFIGNAFYKPKQAYKLNLASFELIPYILSACHSISDVKKELKRINITNDSFDKSLGYSQLHWIASDRESSIVIEPTRNGIFVFDNPVSVLTNNPPFEYHISNLSNYMALSPKSPINQLCPNVNLSIYSRGMGSLGLPGDFSSASRFVRGVFLKNHISKELDPSKEINRFFYMLNGVSVPKGCVISQQGLPVYTIYSSCYDLDNFCLYYKEYDQLAKKHKAISPK